MTVEQALWNILRGKCIPYKKESKDKLAEVVEENKELKNLLKATVSKDAYKKSAIIIDQIPKENVESVVYCKDCKHCDKTDSEYYVCGMFSNEFQYAITEGDRYCWWGENED